MMGFERFNLRRKMQIHNRQCPAKNMVSTYKHDASQRLHFFEKLTPPPAIPVPVCFLTGHATMYSITPGLMVELIQMGIGRGKTVCEICDLVGNHTDLLQ